MRSSVLILLPLVTLAACSGDPKPDPIEQQTKLLTEQAALLARMNDNLAAMSRQQPTSGAATTVVYPPQPAYPPMAPAAPVFNNIR